MRKGELMLRHLEKIVGQENVSSFGKSKLALVWQPCIHVFCDAACCVLEPNYAKLKPQERFEAYLRAHVKRFSGGCLDENDFKNFFLEHFSSEPPALHERCVCVTPVPCSVLMSKSLQRRGAWVHRAVPNEADMRPDQLHEPARVDALKQHCLYRTFHSAVCTGPFPGMF